MNRYLVFIFSNYYPVGGFHDFHSDHNELEYALKVLKANTTPEIYGEYGHIFDTVDSKIYDKNGEEVTEDFV